MLAYSSLAGHHVIVTFEVDLHRIMTIGVCTRQQERILRRAEGSMASRINLHQQVVIGRGDLDERVDAVSGLEDVVEQRREIELVTLCEVVVGNRILMRGTDCIDLEGIRPLAAGQDVVALSAVEDVVAVSTEQQVVTRSAVQRVSTAVIGRQYVIAAEAFERLPGRRTDDQVGAVSASPTATAVGSEPQVSSSR